MARSESNDLPFFERPDLSPYLVHLTKNSTKADDYSAFDNLVSILKSGEVWGSKGYVKGPNKAACFMVIPLNSLKYVLNTENTNPDKPRYEPYGVIVTKKYAYKNGCRPVMYMSNAEQQLIGIPAQKLWRVVRFEGVDRARVNWIHEREWRCKGSFQLSSNPHAVLVKNVADAKKLRQVIEKDPESFESLPSSIISLSVLCQGLPYL